MESSHPLYFPTSRETIQVARTLHHCSAVVCQSFFELIFRKASNALPKRLARSSGPTSEMLHHYWRNLLEEDLGPHCAIHLSGKCFFFIVTYPTDGSNQEIHTHVFHITSFPGKFYIPENAEVWWPSSLVSCFLNIAIFSLQSVFLRNFVNALKLLKVLWGRYLYVSLLASKICLQISLKMSSLLLSS